MKSFVALFLIFAFEVFAQNQLTCSQNGTRIIFINGIDTELEDKGDEKGESATSHQQLIDQIFKLDIDKQTIDNRASVDVQLSYNKTQGVFPDLLESLKQKIGSLDDPKKYKMLAKYALEKEIYLILDKQGRDELDQIKVNLLNQNPRNEDVVALASKIMDAQTQGKKVILVAHSQGNLFVNESQQVVINNDNFKPQLISNLAVASPSYVLPFNGVRYSNQLDVVGYLGMPNPTVYALKQTRKKDSAYHGFQSTYLALDILGRNYGSNETLHPMREIFKEKMHEVALKLADNCPNELNSTLSVLTPAVLRGDITKLQIEGATEFDDFILENITKIRWMGVNNNVIREFETPHSLDMSVINSVPLAFEFELPSNNYIAPVFQLVFKQSQGSTEKIYTTINFPTFKVQEMVRLEACVQFGATWEGDYAITQGTFSLGMSPWGSLAFCSSGIPSVIERLSGTSFDISISGQAPNRFNEQQIYSWVYFKGSSHINVCPDPIPCGSIHTLAPFGLAFSLFELSLADPNNPQGDVNATLRSNPIYGYNHCGCGTGY